MWVHAHMAMAQMEIYGPIWIYGHGMKSGHKSPEQTHKMNPYSLRTNSDDSVISFVPVPPDLLDVIRLKRIRTGNTSYQSNHMAWHALCHSMSIVYSMIYGMVYACLNLRIRQLRLAASYQICEMAWNACSMAWHI